MKGCRFSEKCKNDVPITGTPFSFILKDEISRCHPDFVTVSRIVFMQTDQRYILKMSFIYDFRSLLTLVFLGTAARL